MREEIWDPAPGKGRIGVSRQKWRGAGGAWGSHVRVEEEVGVSCQAKGADRSPRGRMGALRSPG